MVARACEAPWRVHYTCADQAGSVFAAVAEASAAAASCEACGAVGAVSDINAELDGARLEAGFRRDAAHEFAKRIAPTPKEFIILAEGGGEGSRRAPEAEALSNRSEGASRLGSSCLGGGP